MALASGLSVYTPPKSVALFERRNALLPALYAASSDAVLLLHDLSPSELRASPFFRDDLRVIPLSAVGKETESIVPWGWNKALRALLLRHGYPAALMPSDAVLDCWRDLAHRRTALRLCELIGTDTDALPREMTDPTEAIDYVKQRGRVMLKMPWSSSGRGVLAVSSPDDFAAAERRAADCIAKQGSVMIEPLYRKVCDFATEWISDGRDVEFCGFSMFLTDRCGRYEGNIVASQERLLSRLSAFAPAERLERVPRLLKPALKRLLIEMPRAAYVGPFGVDGLIAEGGEVVAALELNLRFTMGHVALRVGASGSESPESMLQCAGIQ